MIRLVARRVLLPFAACLMLVAAVATTGLTASNTVPVTGASDQRIAISIGPVAPPECSAIDFDTTNTVTEFNYSGSNKNDLIMGGSIGQILSGGNGDDCIDGAGGNDLITGGNGRDILLGGPGDDLIFGGNGNDVCYGGPGDDYFYECETIFDP